MWGIELVPNFCLTKTRKLVSISVNVAHQTLIISRAIAWSLGRWNTAHEQKASMLPKYVHSANRYSWYVVTIGVVLNT